MSVFAQAAQVIASLLGLSQQFAGVGLDANDFSGSDPSANYKASMGTSMGGDSAAILARIGVEVASLNGW